MFLVDCKLLRHMNGLMIRANFTPNETTFKNLESTAKTQRKTTVL
jgi:hypothetical protein